MSTHDEELKDQQDYRMPETYAESNSDQVGRKRPKIDQDIQQEEEEEISILRVEIQ